MTQETADDDEVGWWAQEKYDRVAAYVDASRGARRKWLGARGAGATYIDPFCGYPDGRVRETNGTYASGAIAACREAKKNGSQFTEVHIGDTRPEKVERTAEALEPFGISVHTYVGKAQETVPRICKRLNPHGLHLAFLDPYNIANLELDMVQQLGQLRYIDIIAHVSINDLQRTIPLEIRNSSGGRVEKFAPDWRHRVDLKQSKRRVVQSVLEYWQKRVGECGMFQSDHAHLVRGGNRQPLYYLVFLCKNEFPERIWRSIQDLSGTTRHLGL